MKGRNTKIQWIALVSTLLFCASCSFKLAELQVKRPEPRPFMSVELTLVEQSWLQTLNGRKRLAGAALIDPKIAIKWGLDLLRNCIQLVEFDDGEGELLADFVSEACGVDLADVKNVRFSFRPQLAPPYQYELVLEDPEVVYGKMILDPVTQLVMLIDLCSENCTPIVEEGVLRGIEY